MYPALQIAVAPMRPAQTQPVRDYGSTPISVAHISATSRSTTTTPAPAPPGQKRDHFHEGMRVSAEILKHQLWW